MALRRISRELQDWEKSGCDGVFKTLIEDDVFRWQGVILGPENSLYEHGVFHFTAEPPRDSYPFKDPKLRIRTPILHSGICTHGCHICMGGGGTGDTWSPANTIQKLLVATREGLHHDWDTNQETLRPELSRLYRTDKAAYGKKVREHVLMHAVPRVFSDMHGIQQIQIFGEEGVPTLQYQCRRQIRLVIKLRNPWDITDDIGSLPLPQKIKEFLQ